MTLLVAFVFWVTCGVLHFGLHFGYFQNNYPTIAEKSYRSDLRDAFLLSFCGPIALLAHFTFLMFSAQHKQPPLKWK